MAAFGLSKLPFFSSRRAEDDGDARFEDTSPLVANQSKRGQVVPVEADQPQEKAPPMVAKREAQIDGQAIRRPVSGTAAVEGGFLSLAGIREHYMAEEPEKGYFLIRHIESGQEVTISGIDYIQFADLTVSCAFLTRSNSDDLVLPAPSDGTREVGGIHDLAKEVAAAVDEGLLDGDSTQEETPGESSDAAAPLRQEQQAPEAPAADKTASTSAVTITAAELLAGAGDEASSLEIVNITCQQEGRLETLGEDAWTFHPGPSFDGEIALELTIRDADGAESSVEAILTIEAEDPQPGDTQAAAVEPVATSDVATSEVAASESDATGFAKAPDGRLESKDQSPAGPVIDESAIEPASIEPASSEPASSEPTPSEPTLATPVTALQSDSQPEPAPQAQPEDLIVKVSELIGEDFEGQNVQLHDFTQPDNGRLSDNGDGTLSFTPNPGWDGSTTFTYSVVEESGKITSCTLLVELDPEEEPREAPVEPVQPESAASHDPSPIDIAPLEEDTMPPAENADAALEIPAGADTKSEDTLAELYAGARYEDVELDEDDRPIGAAAVEMIALLQGTGGEVSEATSASGGASAADILGSLKADTRDRPLDSAAEVPQKPKKRSKNAEAAEALFKQLDW